LQRPHKNNYWNATLLFWTSEINFALLYSLVLIEHSHSVSHQWKSMSHIFGFDCVFERPTKFTVPRLAENISRSSRSRKNSRKKFLKKSFSHVSQ